MCGVVWRRVASTWAAELVCDPELVHALVVRNIERVPGGRSRGPHETLGSPSGQRCRRRDSSALVVPTAGARHGPVEAENHVEQPSFSSVFRCRGERGGQLRMDSKPEIRTNAYYSRSIPLCVGILLCRARREDTVEKTEELVSLVLC